MTSLLARLGHLETRTTAQTLWSSGKRKRGDWVCRECRARKVLQQRRGYGDDSLRLPVDQSLFPPRELKEEDEKDRTFRSVPAGRERARAQVAHRDRWGYSPGDGTVRRRAQADDGFAEHDASSGIGQDDDRTASQESSQDMLWERFEQVEDEGATAEDDVDGVRAPTRDITDEFGVDTGGQAFSLHAERDASLLHLDYAARLHEALLRREMDLTARCLFAASQANDLDFIRSIDSATFSEILNVVEPANSIDRLASAHLEISGAMAKQLGIASMHKIAWEHSQVVSEIVAIRRSAGIKPTRSDYAVLLRSARDLGNRRMAHHLWRKLQEDGHVPDIACYNYYMAVVIFDRVHNASSRHKLRIIPFHMLARKAARPGAAFLSYRTGTGGVKEKVMYIFGQMLKNGVIADEESFRVVIMAAAREGELSAVKSVLRKVWNVDVDALLAGKDEAEILPKQLPKDSPLYPTSKLLFAIAHAFGINNDIPTALRLVDFVARHYNLPIEQEVWSQLFEWTFVLACTRTGAKSRVDGTKKGQLPLQSVLNLWETMTGAPYFVQPTMGMYNRLIKNLFYRDMSPAVVEKMEEGRQIYLQSIAKAKSLWTQLRAEVKLAQHRTPDQEGPASTSLEHLRSEWEHADLLRKRNHFWLRRWLRLLLATLRKRALYDTSGDWALRHIPRMLWEWRVFTPTVVRYETAGGQLEITMRTQEELGEHAVRGASSRFAQRGVLRRVPRWVGQGWLREGVQLLPRRLREAGVKVGSGTGRERRPDAGVSEEEEGSGDGAEEDLRERVRDAIDEALERR